MDYALNFVGKLGFGDTHPAIQAAANGDFALLRVELATKGVAGGDAVLRSVGQLCIRSFRGVDMAARVGGEEFAVLLPGASAQQAGAVMERFLHTLGDMDMDVGTQNVRITATAGVAQQQPGEDLDTLMARADTALYAGKEAGRNRVVLAPAPD